MKYIIITLTVMLAFCGSVSAADRPAMDNFFEGQRIDQVSISPDGRYLALVMTSNDVHYVSVIDRLKKTPPKPVLHLDSKEHTSFNWCRWAKSDRVLCSVLYTNNTGKMGYAMRDMNFGVTRLIAFNADGSNYRLLIANRNLYGGQLQDHIIDWLRNDPDNVLIDLPDNLQFGYGATDVYRLNIRTGKISVEEHGKKHVQEFATDGNGHIRLASGVEETTFRMYAKAKGSDHWKEIVKREIDLKSESQYLDPQAVIPGTDEAYAIGSYQGFNALWSVSLTGESEPMMLFAHPGSDVRSIFGPDQQLLGVRFDTDKPAVKYFDPQAQLLQNVADQLFPGHINQLMDFSKNMEMAVLRSQTDTEPPFFSVLDLSVQPPKFQRIGSSYPGLKGFDMAKVEPASFPAADGTKVPAYLTKPAGDVDLAKAPLIVLPHGGPYARDQWGFDSWVQFLASRGYVVLQIEFRGSTGYGNSWFKQGFADWGGKPYSDVVDGTKWALSKGYGDPSRTCIVGASFGGYMALLAATRNHESHLYRCAVSISGVSDLRELEKDRRWFRYWQIANQSIGTDREKLKDDSPRMHAADVNIPIMLIHGDEDYTVEVDESEMMDKALNKADKPHQLVIVKGADHYYRDDAYLKQMFTAMSDFLNKQIGVN